MNRLRIGAKLWLAISLLIVSLVGMLAVVSVRSGSAQKQADVLFAESDARSRTASEWHALTAVNLARAHAAIMANGEEVEAVVGPLNARDVELVSALQQRLDAMPLSDDDRRQLAKIAAVRDAVRKMTARARTLKRAGDVGAAHALYQGEGKALLESYLQSLRQFAGMQEQRTAEARRVFAETRVRNMSIGGIMILAIIATAIFGAARLISSIRGALRDAVDAANRIAAGDLTVAPSSARGDEFGDLMRALGGMNASLVNIVAAVRGGTDTIATASGEIAAGNLDLSARTEEQASSLEETAASMEQLTSTVKQNAANAGQADTLAASAAEVAGRGGRLVALVVDKMAAIQDSSRRVVEIIAVIDGIAFQTNILALNAAVEAARAGEQGRGFAVVASEVRALAQRSAGAAREIKTLIGASVEHVGEGSGLVAQAGATMADIVDGIARVSAIMGEISEASREQTSGIEQVNQAVLQMDQVTQQNAALVEQAAAAAQSMQEQAALLAGAVGVFKLSRGQPRPAARAFLA